MSDFRTQPRSAVSDYIFQGHMEVDGWLAVLDAKIIAAIGDAQSESGVVGDLIEIGVYQGRLLVLLGLLRHNREKLIAIDPLCGDTFRGVEVQKTEKRKERLKKKISNNIEAFCGADIAFEHVVKGSDELTLTDIALVSAAARLVSIDGNHQASFVRHDLELIDSVLVEEGVICMDDVFNYSYPGVSNGLHAFLSENRNLVPFYIGPNKVYLCRPSHAEQYRQRLVANKDIPDWGPTAYFEHPVTVCDIDAAGPDGRVKRPPRFIKK